VVERRNTGVAEGGDLYWEPVVHLVYRENRAERYAEPVLRSEERVDQVLEWLARHKVPLYYTKTDLSLVLYARRLAAIGDVPCEAFSYQGLDDLKNRFERG